MANTRQMPVACFAPPLTGEVLARYRQLAGELGDDRAELRDALQACLQCVGAWWELPASTRKDGDRVKIRRVDEQGKPNGHYSVPVTPLEEEHVQQLYEVTPWMRELDSLGNSRDTGLFDSLPEGELRNAAFHLLWHCKELTLDREPLTADKLGGV